MLKKNFINFIIFFSIFLLDRISKIFIVNKSTELGTSEIFNSRFINIELVWNKGIAFGLLSLENSLAYQIISILIFSIIIILVYLVLKTEGFEKFSFIMVLGGAVGNLYDRILFKAVPDFIDIHINDFHWFIFNIADIFITIGVICLILVEISFKKKL